MYAILDVNNRQYKVKQGQEIYVDLQAVEVGTDLTFNKGDKVIIFKKKRRKGYRLKKGHRQQYTKVRIDSITV